MTPSERRLAESLVRDLANQVRLALRTEGLPAFVDAVLRRATEKTAELGAFLHVLADDAPLSGPVSLRTAPCVAQIADTQYGPRHATAARALDEELLRDWRSFEGEEPAIPMPSIIVHCGDLADTGCPTEYATAVTTIERLLAKLSTETRQRATVMVVPGNHDVSHRLSKGICDGLEDATREVDALYPLRIAPFMDALRRLQDDADARLPYWRAYTSPVGELLIVALDSCVREDHERHHGFVDLATTSEALRAARAEFPDALGVVVWHHPPYGEGGMSDYIHNFNELLPVLEEREFALCLHGHLHRFDQLIMQKGTRRPVRIITAGSVSVEASQRPVEGTRGPHTLEYNVLQVTKAHRTDFRVRLHAREYRIGTPGEWGPSPRFGAAHRPYCEIP